MKWREAGKNRPKPPVFPYRSGVVPLTADDSQIIPMTPGDETVTLFNHPWFHKEKQDGST